MAAGVQLLVEQIDGHLWFHWLVGLSMDYAVWNHAVFSKNRDRLLTIVTRVTTQDNIWAINTRWSITRR